MVVPVNVNPCTRLLCDCPAISIGQTKPKHHTKNQPQKNVNAMIMMCLPNSGAPPADDSTDHVRGNKKSQRKVDGSTTTASWTRTLLIVIMIMIGMIRMMIRMTAVT